MGPCAGAVLPKRGVTRHTLFLKLSPKSVSQPHLLHMSSDQLSYIMCHIFFPSLQKLQLDSVANGGGDKEAALTCLET